MGNDPIIARKLRRCCFFDCLLDFTSNLGWRADALAVVFILPDRVAGGDHRDFDAVAVLDPEYFTRTCFVGRVLENENRQQPIGLADEDLASLSCVRGIKLREIEANDADVYKRQSETRARHMATRRFSPPESVSMRRSPAGQFRCDIAVSMRRSNVQPSSATMRCSSSSWRFESCGNDSNSAIKSSTGFAPSRMFSSTFFVASSMKSCGR